MPVVVHDEDARRFTADLEAALDAREAGQRLLDALEGHLEVEAHADGGECVEDVVSARHLDRRRPERLAPVQDLELRLHAGEGEPAGREIGARLEPVGDHALLDLRNHLLDIGLVEAEHGRAVERHLVHEGEEGGADRVEVGVVVEVLGVHRRHDRDGRRELEE